MISENFKIQFVFIIIVAAFVFVVISGVLKLLLPSITYAAVTDANPQCIPWNSACPCGGGTVKTKKGCTGASPNKANCGPGVCISTDSVSGGKVPGTCPISGVCKGESYSGGGQPGGKTDAGLGALKGLIDKAMEALKGGGGGGGGGGMPPPMPPGSGQPPPMPNVLDQLKLPDTSSQLLDDLKKKADSGTSNILDSVFGVIKSKDDEDTTVTNTSSGTSTSNTNSSTSGDSGGSLGDGTGAGTGTTGGTGVVVSGNDAATVSGQRSEVRSSDNEATFEANVRDDEKNAEVGGFYGFTSRAIGQVSVVERLCTSRPWSNSLVSRIIPDSFFDGLCIKRGFDVTVAVGEGSGIQAPANITEAENQVKARIEERKKPNVGSGEPGILCEPEIARPGDDIDLSFSCGAADLTGTSGFTVLEAGETRATVIAVATAQYGISCSNDKIYSCITQVFDPRVSIWADPANVPLGTRTTVFWTTEDVDGCVIKGPSFSETGPFGGASTVPINGLSKYSISCVAPDGKEIKGDTTVDLSI